MKLKIESNNLDLGVTPIENMFINMYLSTVNLEQIKVFLYGFSLATTNRLEEISNESIAKELKLTVGQVIDAWDFWISEDIVEKKDDTYIFKSLRYKYVQEITGLPIKKENLEIKNEDNIEYTLKSKELIEGIERFISFGSDVFIKLNPLEIEKILKYMNEFRVKEDFILYAFPLASTQRNTKSVHQVMETIRNWLINGLNTQEKLNEYLEKEYVEPKKKDTFIKKPKSKSTIGKEERLSKEERRKLIERKLNSDKLFTPMEE